ncbi:Protein interacting with Hsp90 1 [Mycena venus]|uniref:Protein interacting with Hsp90 1 n=1 Tax=Mycena venus TaxID=2733690 RepID=A0A8H6U1Y1_9AGAR|nr:Protein interacting with Hsp90 1 [Mycena venus]
MLGLCLSSSPNHDRTQISVEHSSPGAGAGIFVHRKALSVKDLPPDLLTHSLPAGNPSLVFDCIYHTSIKSRTVRDAAFKVFIQELALQRIEAQTSLVLSRQISTPNIASKGKLLPRTVLIPSSVPKAPKTRPLIEEILPVTVSGSSKPDATTPAKGILKTTGSAPPMPEPARAGPRPSWRWSKIAGDAIEITIIIPSLKRALIAETMLELETRRLLLAVPGHPPLDIDLSRFGC